MEIDTPTVQRLMEIGYVAAGGGMWAEAESIFAAVQAARPESELPQIGRAVARMNAGKAGEAVQILRAALDQNPDSSLAAAFLGQALQQAGLSAAAADVLRQVVAANSQAEAVALARSLLDTSSPGGE